MEPRHGQTSTEMSESAIDRQYDEMMEQSRDARKRGDHWAAQQFATSAHKWAMDERTRLQRLDQARKALDIASKRLQSTWDKDRECATISELHEQHPEFRSVITAWEKAQQRVQELEEPQPCDVPVK